MAYTSLPHNHLRFQDKTGTLTQNKMHVVNVAVDGMVFESSAFDNVLKDAAPAVAANLSQVAAVGGICNSAVFSADSGEGSSKSIAGDATGKHPVSCIGYWI